jgi:hypothetical protein
MWQMYAEQIVHLLHEERQLKLRQECTTKSRENSCEKPVKIAHTRSEYYALSF